MHVGQQEGHADGQDNRGGQKSPVVRLAAENQQGGQHGRSEGEGGQDAQAGGEGSVHLRAVGNQGVHIGGIQVQIAGVLGGLPKIDPQDVPQGLAQQQRGHTGGGIGRRKPQQLPEAHPPEQPQPAPQGEHKDGL